MKTMLSSNRDHCLARVSIFLATVALIAGMVGCGGDGTPTVEIRDWDDLDALRDNLGGSYLLMNDLDSTTACYEELASPTANAGMGWQPIGTCADRFTGSFDGQGYEIRDLFINRPDDEDEYCVGFFGCVDVGSGIKNLGVVNVVVTGKLHDAGGLVGVNWGTVSNSYSSGNVTGHDFVGGLVGYNDGTVSNSYSSTSVTGRTEDAGGLVGGNGGTVSNSYSTGNVTGNLYVGGLAGPNTGIVSNSYSTGNVVGGSWVGGLVGSISEEGTVSNSYATGNVTGGWRVGGLVGGNGGTVSNSYSTGNVTGDEHVGGLVGQNSEGTVSNSFWDTETSGQATSDGGTGKTTTEMQDIATFLNTGWSICTVDPGKTNDAHTWNIVDDETYPFLSWQS